MARCRSRQTKGHHATSPSLRTLPVPAASKVVRSRLALGGLGSVEPASPGRGLPRLPAEEGAAALRSPAGLPPPLASGRSRRLRAPPLRTVLWPALGPAAAPPAAAAAGERRKDAMLRCLVVRRVLGAGLFSRSPANRDLRGPGNAFGDRAGAQSAGCCPRSFKHMCIVKVSPLAMNQSHTSTTSIAINSPMRRTVRVPAAGLPAPAGVLPAGANGVMKGARRLPPVCCCCSAGPAAPCCGRRLACAFSSCCPASSIGVPPCGPAEGPAAPPCVRSAASMEALLLPPRPGALHGVADPRPAAAAAAAAEPSAVPGVADPGGASWPTPWYAAAAAAAACTWEACRHQGCQASCAWLPSACSSGCCRWMCHTLTVASSAVVAICGGLGWVSVYRAALVGRSDKVADIQQTLQLPQNPPDPVSWRQGHRHEADLVEV